uniref:Uncharacterized protein n=1 Tax=Coturnix japonica TaxID=93934 RepID=A0A8C2TL50_COTJA
MSSRDLLTRKATFPKITLAVWHKHKTNRYRMLSITFQFLSHSLGSRHLKPVSQKAVAQREGSMNTETLNNLHAGRDENLLPQTRLPTTPKCHFTSTGSFVNLKSNNKL